MTTAPRHTNRLAKEASPYLQQHAHNPVDWYPWGDEALARAKAEDKPILLSVGYSACHWCHVMEHESFSNEAVAEQMNASFVCVKVDREERPDIDHVYQMAHQLMTRRAGGWPLTVFLLPDGRPFFAGTYFPPEGRYGMPGFAHLLEMISVAWREKRADLEEGAEQARHAIEAVSTHREAPGTPSAEGLDAAGRYLAGKVDRRYGGFGERPKFPNTMAVSCLMRHHERTGDAEALALATRSLDGMHEGGVYDHLGGGFHRYSTDERWLVPHFEKMLYDNALLVPLYVEGWRRTGKKEWAEVVRETLGWLRREMTSPQGGFYATQDADSEGEEGKFFVWTPEEVAAVLGPDDGRVFCGRYGVAPGGNFEGGKTVLHLNRSVEAVAPQLGRAVEDVERVLTEARPKMFDARAKRVPPFRDEKIIASWNGLMLSAVADAYATFGDAADGASAVQAAAFLEDKMMDGDRLARAWKDGKAYGRGFIEDYASVGKGMLDLYQATLDERWLAVARRMADVIRERFWDDASGLMYFTERDAEAVVTRPVDDADNATPSGTSVAAHLFLALHAIQGRDEDLVLGRRIVEGLWANAVEMPFGHTNLLGAADLLVRGAVVIALAGDPADPALQGLARAAARRPAMNRVVLRIRPDDTLGRVALNGQATAYVCRGTTCSAPVTDERALADLVTA